MEIIDDENDDGNANDNANAPDKETDAAAPTPPTEPASVAETPVNPEPAAPAAEAAETATEPAPVNPEPAALADASITVTVEGEFTGSYVGPAGKPLKEMFAQLKDVEYQLRNKGKIVKQDAPWTETASLKAVAHAKHG